VFPQFAIFFCSVALIFLVDEIPRTIINPESLSQSVCRKGMDDDGEQFSLRWNNFHTNLSSGFYELFEEKNLVDVTLACEGQYIQAHRAVLTVCSPYFKSLFKVSFY
jgi:BTB/POZ domain